MVNDNMARVLDRFMMFNGGVAYGIDQLLEPPGLGAHCDGLENRTTYSRCGSCLNPRHCPQGTEDTEKTEFCSFINPYSSFFPRRHSVMYDHHYR
uniref:Uncharacterized protein n=1 Tax=Hucho hucho TaxID=62062 RepID=A0A4W5R4B5_9TELE